MQILEGFGEATGLKMNPQKSSVAPIRCEGIDLDHVLQNFGGNLVSFPIRYLGLPVCITRVRLVHLQYILDRIRPRLAGWKGRLLPIAGRRVLVRCVLTALPVFALAVLRAPKKLYKEVDKARRRFLWAQDEELTGGKCKVNWRLVTTPTDRGGLGIPDKERFARALRLRWLWMEWKHPERPWVGTGSPCDDKDRALFTAATTVTIDNGKRALFWSCTWLGNQPLHQSFPTLFKHSIRKNRTVAEALKDDKWILDLRDGNTDAIIPQAISLLRRIRQANVVLIEDAEDEISWRAAGQYTARAAYDMQFEAQPRGELQHLVWKIWAPGEIKFYLWLLHHNRLWCNDRLRRRGWENSYFCQLCNRSLESSVHLLWECLVSKVIWSKAAAWNGCSALSPATWARSKTTMEAITAIIAASPPCAKKGIKTMVALLAWYIWQERNCCTFRGKTASANNVIEACRRDMEQWRLAGANGIATPFGEIT